MALSQTSNREEENIAADHPCRTHMLSIVYRCLSDCLLCRMISCVFTLQAGIIWLGFALNFILQLLFLPFDQHHTRTFLGSYLMIPGTVAFSAHYFWYIVQTACHAFQRDVPADRSIVIQPADFLLLLINANRMAKRIYRLSITLATITCLVYYSTQDSWQMLIITAGEVPLILLWALNVTHSAGMLSFLIVSCCAWARGKLKSTKSSPLTPTSLRQHPIDSTCLAKVSLLVIQIIIPFTLQVLAVVHHVTWLPLFMVWLLLFGRNWSASKNDIFPVCFHCCSQPSTSKDPLEKQRKRLITYKIFILFILSAMMTSLTFTLRSRIALDRSETIAAICVLVIAGVFSTLLLMPAYLDLKYLVLNLVNIQVCIMNILLLIASILVLIGAHLLLLNVDANKWIIIACLVPFLLHLLLLFIYFLYFTISDTRSGQGYYTSGLSQWIESHHQISIFRNAFYAVFAVMIVIGFVGLGLSSSVFFHEKIPADNRTYSGEMLLKQDEETMEDTMKACNWQFHSLTIQDMVLIAALAYRPTDQVRIELEQFFGPSNGVRFELDENLSNYKTEGYGHVTYFTLTTADLVIVSIRGTQLLYEWLIDFDTWTESFIYQIVSMLFPWSKLFPEYLTSKIVQHMSLLKKLNRRSEESKRFYVLQMIEILKRIYEKHSQKKSFIVLGHSLGGGLAKLSGIALNFTDVLISISGPGITHAHATVDQIRDIPMKTINRRIFNIYHDRDLVPWIDKQEGLTQIVTCPLKFRRLQCHSITPLFCHVVRICGNPRQFKVNSEICTP